MNVRAVTPILRSFDETEARAFYCEYLGARELFAHRFEPGTPLYLGLALGAVELHLSEHHGDACPGARLRLIVEDLDGFLAELASRPHPRLRPGLPEETPWGTRELTLTDPFGNRLTLVADEGPSAQ